MSDDEPLECQAAQEALSALIDHEEPGVGTPWLTEHLVACPGCRAWYEAALELRRRTRLTPTPDVPPLRQLIRSAVGEEAPPPGLVARLRPHLPRAVLVLAALLLLWRSAPALLLGHDPDTGMHPAHELGSFEVALALSLLLCAVWPQLSRTTAPAVGVVALLLVTTALIDLAHPGRTSWTDEAPHLLWLVAFLALVAIPRTPRADDVTIAESPEAPPGRRRTGRVSRPAAGPRPGPSTPTSTHRSA